MASGEGSGFQAPPGLSISRFKTTQLTVQQKSAKV